MENGSKTKELFGISVEIQRNGRRWTEIVEIQVSIRRKLEGSELIIEPGHLLDYPVTTELAHVGPDAVQLCPWTLLENQILSAERIGSVGTPGEDFGDGNGGSRPNYVLVI